MKFYAKCSTEDGNITLAISAENKDVAIAALHKTYNIVSVLDIKDANEYNFISQKEQFKNVPTSYRKENKAVGTSF